MRQGAAAVVVAAGRGTRMGSDKIWAELCGRPVLAHSLAAFDAAPGISAVVVVVRAERIEIGQVLVERCGFRRITAIVAGGDRRQDSVAAGLAALDPAAHDVVLVHDGARPLVDQATITEGILAAREHGAAVAATPVVDTIKRVDGEGIVRETLDRSVLWAVQTPQAFRLDLLLRAHEQIREDATDDAALVERLGHPVRVYAGSPRNLKITGPADLIVAEALLRDG